MPSTQGQHVPLTKRLWVLDRNHEYHPPDGVCRDSGAEVHKTFIKPAVEGTTNVLKSAQKNNPNVKRVVITSSFAAIVNPPKTPRHQYTGRCQRQAAADREQRTNGISSRSITSIRRAPSLLASTRTELARRLPRRRLGSSRKTRTRNGTSVRSQCSCEAESSDHESRDDHASERRHPDGIVDDSS